jgi:hypothetical protein
VPYRDRADLARRFFSAAQGKPGKIFFWDISPDEKPRVIKNLVTNFDNNRGRGRETGREVKNPQIAV